MRKCLFGVVLIICACKNQELNFENPYAKAFLDSEIVEEIESQFEQDLILDSLIIDREYWQIINRYRDLRMKSFLSKGVKNDNIHMQWLSLATANQIEDLAIEEVLKLGLTSADINTKNLSRLYLKTRSLNIKSVFDTIPMLQKADFKKEFFIFKDVDNHHLKLKELLIDTNKDNYSYAYDYFPPSSSFNDSLMHTPSLDNFGIVVGGVYHVGYDHSWDMPGFPVVSAVKGKVRAIVLDISWGVLVGIESIEGLDTLTYLYGHLSEKVFVRPGQYVRAGQLIGFIGNPFTITNGGYRGHLHFGIAKLPYIKTAFAGYDTDTTLWINPRNHINDRVNYSAKKWWEEFWKRNPALD